MSQKHNSISSCNLLLIYTTFIFVILTFLLLILFIYLFIFRKRGREGEREGVKHQCVVASCTPLAGDMACNPGMCPDWELNRNALVHRPVLNPLSYTSQGDINFLKLAEKVLKNTILYIFFLECIKFPV